MGKDGLLEFSEDIIAPKAPDVRRLKDAVDVLYEKTTENGEKPLYYMYRGVSFKKDLEVFKKNNIRYDITVILPGKIGKEYIKTVGHFHPLKQNSTETYTEYYEVIDGDAIYLLQKNNEKGEAIEVVAVKAKKGEKVYIPSGYGHITINPGGKPLVMANIVESNFSSIYEPFKKKHGAAYYYIEEAENKRGGVFIKNKNYAEEVELKVIEAKKLKQQIKDLEANSIYEAFLKNPGAFSILK